MNFIKSFFLIIAFLSFFITCKDKTNNEVEPNDKFSGSNIIQIDNKYFGKISTPNDIDNYYLKAESEKYLSLSLSGLKGVNHAIKIWEVKDSNPYLLKVIDDNRKSSPEYFMNMHIAKGEYIFSITHGRKDKRKGNRESTYSFELKSMNLSNHESEPNDDKDNAGFISSGTGYGGYFSPSFNFMNQSETEKYSEVDWFYFTVSEEINVPIKVDVTLSGVEGIDSVLRIYDSNSKLLFQADDNGQGIGEQIRSIGIGKRGDYYISVQSKNYNSNIQSPYEILFSFVEHDEGAEFERNDDFISANILVNGEITGIIENNRDVDFFEVNSDYEGFKSIEVKGSDGKNIKLDVYSDQKKVIGQYINENGGSVVLVPNIFFKKKAYIKISGDSVDNGYEVKVTDLDVTGSLEIEPNGKKEKASDLKDAMTGYISSFNDSDYYVVKTDGRKKIEISVTGVKDGEIVVSTTDSLGFIINSVTVKGNRKTILNELVNKVGYIIVEGKSKVSKNPYFISIREIQ